MKSKYAMAPNVAASAANRSPKGMTNKNITAARAQMQAAQPLQPLRMKIPVSKSKHMQQHVAGAQGQMKFGGGPDGANISAD